MEQHPVPQDITGFKFKLVGDMTLKQFGELAFGAIIAYLFYATGWPGFIKMPLTIMFGLLGFALAFLPIQERPLDLWIVNFLKAIYRPTLYVWQKGSEPVVFSSPPVVLPSVASAPIIPPPTPTRISPTPSIEDLQELRDKKILETQGVEEKQAIILPKVTINEPKGPEVVTVDSLAMLRDEKQLADEEKKRALDEQNQNLTAQIETVKTKIQALQGMDTTELQAQLANLSAQKESFFPKETPFEGVKIVEKSATHQATVSLTEIPNILNGLVINEKGVPLENTILIVKDKIGNSIRALKSNQVGQFIASTPLENGTYYLEFERQGYTFDILEITLSGKILEPLKITAKTV